jgi:hypothetical protein
VHVQGLSEQKVESAKELLQLLATADASRVTAATKLNASSSRSHAVLTLTLTMPAPRGGRGRSVSSRANLVDLAGSERCVHTHSPAPLGSCSPFVLSTAWQVPRCRRCGSAAGVHLDQPEPDHSGAGDFHPLAAAGAAAAAAPRTPAAASSGAGGGGGRSGAATKSPGKFRSGLNASAPSWTPSWTTQGTLDRETDLQHEVEERDQEAQAMSVQIENLRSALSHQQDMLQQFKRVEQR